MSKKTITSEINMYVHHTGELLILEKNMLCKAVISGEDIKWVPWIHGKLIDQLIKSAFLFPIEF